MHSSNTSSMDGAGPSYLSAVPTDEYASVQELLSHHSSKTIDKFSEYSLAVDRSTPDHFWMAVMSFYKGALSKPEKLKRCLVVTFVNSGEDGSDAGALMREFFEDSLRQVNERLFEGDETRRIPKKDVSMDMMFEVAGMKVGHSLVQGGPAMPCLSDSVYDYLTHGDVSKCYQVKEDIPLNLSTHNLITAIEEVCLCLYVKVYVSINCAAIILYVSKGQHLTTFTVACLIDVLLS